MNKIRKRIRITALFLAILLCVQPALSLFAAESEEAVRIIRIYNADDLMELADNCTTDTWSQGKNIVLQADISLKDVEFFTIPTFGGTFDGNGYSVTGFSIAGNYSSIGFFGVLQEGAVVKNLKIEGSVCPGGDAVGVGGIAGINYGRILNCSFTGYVVGDDEVGGIVGVNEKSGEIRRCQANAVVSGNHSAGGIAGVNHGELNNCKNSGDINTQTAGITYEIGDLTIENMKKLNRTENVAAHVDTGGIAGISDGKIYFCTNSGVVGYPHVGYNVGGIVGRLKQGYLQGCTNTNKVYGRKDVGGIAGQMEPFLEIQYLTDKFKELDAEADRFIDLCEDTFNHIDGYGGEALELMKNISGNLDRASEAGKVISDASSDLLHIYNQELGALNNNLKEFGEDLSEESGSGDGGGNQDNTPSVSGGDSGYVPSVSGGDWSGNWDGESGTRVDRYSDLVEKLIRNSSGHVDTILDETENREGLFRDNFQILNAELDAAGDSLKKLSDVLIDGSDVTGRDVDTLAEQARVLRKLVSEIRDDLFGFEGISVTDISGEEEAGENNYDASAFQKGKITQCENRAGVEADINVGGIVGQIATEYDIDPEEDISIVGTESSSVEATVKAVVRDSRNYGEVLSKKDCVGGIIGKTEIGAVISCESYGDVSSTGGNYVGGIAGLSGASVRGCYTKCTLSGNRYIGGVIGSGLSDTDSEAGNIVVGCYAFVNIEEFEQYAGAIAGMASGTFLENYFVSEELKGIDRTNYTAKAEPVKYSDLLELEGLPEEFKQLTLEFVVEDEVVKTVPFEYGESFDDNIFPEIPQKEGYYTEWDTAELKNLQFDTVVTALYLQSISALPGSEQREDNRLIFFAEGQFEKEDFLECEKQETKDETLLTEDYFSFIQNRTRPEMTINRAVVEQWSIQIPDDGLASHAIRYLPPDGREKHLAIYVRQKDGSWSRAEHDVVGSYLRFYVEGEQVELAVVSTVSVWWMWLLAGCFLLLLLLMLAKLVRNIVRRFRKRRIKQAEEPAEPEKKRKPGRRKRILIIAVTGVLLVMALLAAAFLYFRYQFGGSVVAYNLLKDYAEQSEFCMEFDVTAVVNSEEMKIKTQVVRAETEGHTVYCIEQQGMTMYYTDGVVFLENGKAFKAGSLIPDYSALLPHMAQLYHSVDVTVANDREDQQYSIITKQGTVKSLLEILMPSLAEQFSEIQIANVDLYAKEGQLSSIRFASSGTLNDSQKTAVAVTADIIVKNPDADEISIPQAVQEAISGGKYEAKEVLTEDLFRLLRAWTDFSHREKLSARLELKADCGPLTVNDTAQLFRVTENGTRIDCIRKNAKSIYFTEDAVCDRNGRKISSKKEPLAESAELLDFVYQLCLNSNFGCMETGGSYVYTIMLDAEGARSVANTVVPETKNMDIEYGTSSVQITVTKDEIAGIRLVCDGSLEVLHLDTPISVAGEIWFETDGALDDFSIPKAVLEALTAGKDM